MASTATSELPLHYGEKMSTGETVERPTEGIQLPLSNTTNGSPLAAGQRPAGSHPVESAEVNNQLTPSENRSSLKPPMSRRVSQFIEDLGPQDEGCEHVSNSGKPVNGPLPDDSRARRISSAAGWLNPATLSGGGGKENEGHYYPEASSQHWRPAQAPISSEPGSQGTLQPPPAQYLRNRGRPMSFYDIREAREQHGSSGKGSQRQSWASNNDYPHSYAGMSGADQYQYNPPSRAQQLQQTRLASDKETIPLRLPWTLWMNSTAKNHFVAAVGEFVGTLLFLFFAFAGTQVAIAKEPNTATTNQLMAIRPIIILYVSLSFGFSLMVNVWVFFRISGGLFNPAVTLAMLLVGAISRLRALCLFLAQVAGAIAASGLVMAVFPVRLSVNTTLSDGTSLVRGVFIEALLTAELVFTVLMLAKEKHKANFIAPVGIGLALFIVHLVGVFYTGGSANPARSLGPCIVTNTYDKELWIYWAGPFIGVLIAVAFYKFIKVLEYEMANPGQDGDDPNDPTKNSDHEVREKQRHYTARVLQSLGLDHLGMHHHEAHGQGVGRQPWAQTLMDGPVFREVPPSTVGMTETQKTHHYTPSAASHAGGHGMPPTSDTPSTMSPPGIAAKQAAPHVTSARFPKLSSRWR